MSRTHFIVHQADNLKCVEAFRLLKFYLCIDKSIRLTIQFDFNRYIFLETQNRLLRITKNKITNVILA